MDTPEGGESPTVDQLIEHVHQWLASGVSRGEAAERLAELAPSRTIVQDMDVTLLRTVARLRSDDFPATAVLRATEAALRLMPRPGPEHR